MFVVLAIYTPLLMGTVRVLFVRNWTPFLLHKGFGSNTTRWGSWFVQEVALQIRWLRGYERTAVAFLQSWHVPSGRGRC